jgi:hypothetical protein
MLLDIVKFTRFYVAKLQTKHNMKLQLIGNFLTRTCMDFGLMISMKLIEEMGEMGMCMLKIMI